MYKHLKSLAVFIAVAQTGAFNKAAQKLGLKPSVVSHHINKLEAHLGTCLIYRSTRQLSLSEQGKALYQSSHSLFEDTESLFAQFSSNSNEPRGLLRISLPQFIPDPKIEQAIWSFHEQYSNVELMLNYTDKQIQLPSSDIDLAIRIGRQTDSSLMTKKLSFVEHILVASPLLLAGQDSAISAPEQLAHLQRIKLNCTGKTLILTQLKDRKEIKPLESRVTVNSINAALSATIAGIGFADLPPALCQQALKNGQLIKLFPEWRLTRFPICATYSGKALDNSLIKLLLVHIEQELSEQQVAG